VGAILTGKVTGITTFGAFIALAPGKSGLVHISEIANTYVSDVSSHLSEGQEVTVKVIGVDKSGRLNLSIKSALPPESQTTPHPRPQQRPPQRQGNKPAQKPSEPAAPPTFEDKLKRFMQDSDNKMSGLKQYSDKKGGRRRGR